MKKLFNLAVFIVSFSAFQTTHAMLVLQVTGGQPTEATGVEMSGILCDVESLDRSCSTLFTGRDAITDTAFTARNESSALEDQVFKYNAILGDFDTNPSLTTGIASTIGEIIVTPYAFPTGTNVSIAFFTNDNFESNDSIGTSNIFRTSTLALNNSAARALWELTPVTAPSPLHPPAARDYRDVFSAKTRQACVNHGLQKCTTPKTDKFKNQLVPILYRYSASLTQNPINIKDIIFIYGEKYGCK